MNSCATVVCHISLGSHCHNCPAKDQTPNITQYAWPQILQWYDKLPCLSMAFRFVNVRLSIWLARNRWHIDTWSQLLHSYRLSKYFCIRHTLTSAVTRVCLQADHKFVHTQRYEHHPLQDVLLYLYDFHAILGRQWWYYYWPLYSYGSCKHLPRWDREDVLDDGRLSTCWCLDLSMSW